MFTPSLCNKTPERVRSCTGRFAASALLVVLAVWSLPARAEVAPDECLREVGDANSEVVLNAWFARAPRCGSHARYLFRLGQLLNAAHRYDEALEYLEGAMLREPGDWRIEVEYAIALAGSGDEMAARALLRQLRNHPEIDAAVRQEIGVILDRRWMLSMLPRGMVSVTTGYDDNLLGTPFQGPFDLTLPLGRLTVTPDGSRAPLRGRFIRADVRLEGAISNGNDERLFHYGLFGSWRWTPGQPAERSHWGGMLEKYNKPAGEYYFQAAYQQLTLESRDIYRQAQIGAGRLLTDLPGLLGCAQRIGLEVQVRQYPQIRALDGTYTGVHMSSSCSWLGLQLRHGRDEPRDGARPGGGQDQTMIRLTGQTIFMRGIMLAEAEYFWQRDGTGYSPWLENNRRRRIDRSVYRLEYRWPSSGWQPYVGIESLVQKANLPLFSLRNTLFSVGVSQVW